MIMDLSTEEAILRCNVAFDINETFNAIRLLVSQYQTGKSPHGMAYQMELVDSEMREHGLRGFHQECDVDAREVGALRFTAAWRIIGNEGVSFERCLQRDIGVILFGGTETVKEQDGRFWPGAVYHRHIELYTIDVQWDFLVREASCMGHGYKLL